MKPSWNFFFAKRDEFVSTKNSHSSFRDSSRRFPSRSVGDERMEVAFRTRNDIAAERRLRRFARHWEEALPAHSSPASREHAPSFHPLNKRCRAGVAPWAASVLVYSVPPVARRGAASRRDASVASSYRRGQPWKENRRSSRRAFFYSMR